jgi:hypothetical protein
MCCFVDARGVGACSMSLTSDRLGTAADGFIIHACAREPPGRSRQRAAGPRHSGDPVVTAGSAQRTWSRRTSACARVGTAGWARQGGHGRQQGGHGLLLSPAQQARHSAGGVSAAEKRSGVSQRPRRWPRCCAAGGGAAPRASVPQQYN